MQMFGYNNGGFQFAIQPHMGNSFAPFPTSCMDWHT
jgi:hypothetical protein